MIVKIQKGKDQSMTKIISLRSLLKTGVAGPGCIKSQQQQIITLQLTILNLLPNFRS